nr:MAG TPA: hypothetical protein [Caudoviricetes sp.]
MGVGNFTRCALCFWWRMLSLTIIHFTTIRYYDTMIRENI